MNRIVKPKELECWFLIVRKGSLIIVKFQRKSLNESLEHEEVSNNRCDQSKLQCANSCFRFIIFRFVFYTNKAPCAFRVFSESMTVFQHPEKWTFKHSVCLRRV